MEFKGRTRGRQRQRGTSREVRDPQRNMHVPAQLKVTTMNLQQQIIKCVGLSDTEVSHGRIMAAVPSKSFQTIIRKVVLKRGNYRGQLSTVTLKHCKLFLEFRGERTDTKSAAPLSSI